MSDKKSYGSKSKQGAMRRRGRRGRNGPRAIALNEMMYSTRWEYGGLSTGTAGTIAQGNCSPSIQNSSEYSVLQNLFTEVKLVRAVVVFTGQAQSLTTVVQSRLWVGTNMIFTAATFTTPTSVTNVQNLTKVVQVPSNLVRSYRYRFPVPPGLEFSNITQDSPTTATPWAGSPGNVVWWGDGFTVSQAYYRVDVEAVFHMRGRQ